MKKMLVVDNTEMNKSILHEIFYSLYELIETDSSETALKLIKQYKNDISIILINEKIAHDFSSETIKRLTDEKIFENIPVILILNNDYFKIRNSFDNLYFSDVIASPVNPYIIKKRVENLVELFSHKNKLEKIVDEQTEKIIAQNKALKIQQKKMKSLNNDMIDILSTVIEYRDVESGKHIHRIRKFTEVLLRAIAEKYPKYNLTEEKINLITSASAIHDIGKIAIPDSILLCPRRLTVDEFRIIKQHTTKGCEILEQIDSIEHNEYFKYCYQICRYHHEKWDGLGYPDGLSGNDIPICAQVVSVADCYDALTSERSYKSAFTHEQAVEMIRAGACGAFSDEMMDCFSSVLPKFKKLTQEYADPNHIYNSISEEDKNCIKYDDTDHSKDIYMKMDRNDLIDAIERQKKIMLEIHKRDCKIIYKISDAVFECNIKQNAFYERKGNINKFFGHTPKNYEDLIMLLSEKCSSEYKSKFIGTFRIENVIKEALSGKEKISLECPIKTGKKTYSNVHCSVVPIMKDKELIKIYCVAIILKKNADNKDVLKIIRNYDSVTELLNYSGVCREIEDYLIHTGKSGKHLLLNISIDDFKDIENYQTEYNTKDKILYEIAKTLKNKLPNDSIIGHTSVDSFSVFIKDCPADGENAKTVENIFRELHKDYLPDKKNVRKLSFSIGVAKYPDDGESFNELFKNASRASNIAQINGKDMYLFYNSKMKENWEIKKYAAIVSENEKINLMDFEKCIIPVADSNTGKIISYDFIEVLKGSISSTSFDEIYDSVYYTTNVTALSLNSMKRIISAVYSMEQENIHIPPISIMTMFNGFDSENVINAIGEILAEFPINCRNICINITQDMFKTLNLKGLVGFIESLRNYGFKTGVYNVGMNSINMKCFTQKLFDRVTLANSFLNNIKDGIYPVELVTYLIDYFSHFGTEVYMPAEVDRETVEILTEKSSVSFGIHQNRLIKFNDFKESMQFASMMPEYPILSHETSHLVLNEKMYDDILEHTKIFIFEWIPRLDTVKFSGSFEKIYGYIPVQNDFIKNIKKSTFIHSDDIKKFLEKISLSRSEDSNEDCLIRVFNKKIQGYVWNRISFMTIKNELSVPIKIIAVCTDVSKEQDNIDVDTDIFRSVRTDYITNLYNKHAVENKIKNYIFDGGISGHHALMLVEICNFEILEQNLGSVFANAVLKETAGNIHELFRDSDIIGRGSGNRFIIFVKNINDAEKLKERAEQICSTVSNKYQSDTDDIFIVGKVGISMFPKNGGSYDELYAQALKALYYAKKSTDQNIVFANDINIELLHE